MPRGGARPGAGRKPKSEKFGPQIDKADSTVFKALPKHIAKMMELAEGVTVQEPDEKTGEPRIYTKAPDRQALQYLIDRALGKPTEKKEIDVPGEIKVRVVGVDVNF